MGGEALPKEPVLFSKPWSSIAYNPTKVILTLANEHKIDHEIELGVYIGKGGKNISIEKAM